MTLTETMLRFYTQNVIRETRIYGDVIYKKRERIFYKFKNGFGEVQWLL